MALLDGLTRDDTVLLWQVAIEFESSVYKVRRRGGTTLEPDDALSLFRDRFKLVIPDEDVIEIAAIVRRQHGVQYWDSPLMERSNTKADRIGSRLTQD